MWSAYKYILIVAITFNIVLYSIDARADEKDLWFLKGSDFDGQFFLQIRTGQAEVGRFAFSHPGSIRLEYDNFSKLTVVCNNGFCQGESKAGAPWFHDLRKTPIQILFNSPKRYFNNDNYYDTKLSKGIAFQTDIDDCRYGQIEISKEPFDKLIFLCRFEDRTKAIELQLFNIDEKFGLDQTLFDFDLLEDKFR